MLKALFYPDVDFDTLYIPYIYREIYFDGVYIDVLNNRKDMVILDVGANIGVTVQHFRDHGKVYAIEPSPEHFEALKMNKEYNHWDNVELFNVALADKDGEMGFYINKNNRTCNTLVTSHEKTLKVKTMAFDTFFEQNKIEKIDFCKFDVEGAEDMILRSEGFKKVCEKIKAIEVEFHYASWPALVDYMKSLGYSARQYQAEAIIILFSR